MVAGLVAALSASLLWGAVPTLFDDAVKRHGSITTNMWKSWGALFMTSLLVITLNRWQVPPAEATLAIMLNALMVGGLGDYAFLNSIKSIGPGKATPIAYTFILWTAVLSPLVYGEQVTKLTYLGVITAFIGVGITSYEEGSWDLRGLTWALLASFLWTLSPLLMKGVLFVVDYVSASFWNSLFLAVMFTALSRRYAGEHMVKAMLGGALGVGMAVPLFYYALSTVGVVIPVMFSSFTPVISTILSTLGGKSPGRRSTLGSAIITLGIILGVLGST